MGKKILAWFGAVVSFLIVLGITMTPLEETLDVANDPGTVTSAAPPTVIRFEEEPEMVHGSMVSEPQTPMPTSVPTSELEPAGMEYVLNINSRKFHIPSCPSVDLMNESNKRFFTGTRNEVIKKGFVPCKNCNP